MCGIVGYVGSKNVQNVLLEGLLIVLDNAIMNNRQFFFAISMGVGILLVWFSVGCPSSVTDTC